MLTGLKKLEYFINEIPGKFGVPGVDCVIYKSHRQVFRCAAGYFDIEKQIPVRLDALYNIYSATKIVTCVAAMQLVEKGKILLSDPLCEYLPEFKDMRVKRSTFTITPAQCRIRIVDLFTMSAGLGYETDTPELQKLIVETNRNFNTRDFIRALARGPLLFEPGEKWNYSFCHDVLGAVIEAVSGMSFGEYLKKNIFDPLGMENTGFFLSEKKLERLAPQYRYNIDSRTVERISSDCIGTIGLRHESGGGGLISSLEDYILFADALACGGVGANGERIISKKSIDLMRKNHLDEKRLQDFWNMGYAKGTGYGLGVGTVTDSVAACTLAPEKIFFWGGIGGVQVLIDPDNELSLFMAQHTIGSPNELIRQRLWNILYSSI